MKKVFLLTVVITISVGLLLVGCGKDQVSSDSGNSGSNTEEKLVIRYGSADAEDTAVVQGIFAFKKHVESASNGSITVEPYINGVLGGDRELTEALQLGTVDMTVVLGGILANYDPVLNIFSLPYLFESKQATYDAVDGDFGEALVERIESINFKLLGWADGGTYQVANSVKPLTSLADIKGIKIRVPEIEADIEFFKAMGAAPTPISFSETYTSLEQGVVDGLELPIELMYASKLMEPVKYLTLTGHSESIFPVLMSLDFWNKMTPEQQKIVMDGMKVQIEENRELAQEAEEKYIEEFKKMGGTVNVLADEEKQEFIKVGEQIQDKFAPEVGTDLIKLAKSFNK